MKTTVNYLDEIVKQHGGLPRDSALAHFLGITRQAVSQYRTGSAMSIQIAVQVAEILDIDKMETISATMIEQSKTEEQKVFWQKQYLMAKNKRNK